MGHGLSLVVSCEAPPPQPQFAKIRLDAQPKQDSGSLFDSIAPLKLSKNRPNSPMFKQWEGMCRKLPNNGGFAPWFS